MANTFIKLITSTIFTILTISSISTNSQQFSRKLSKKDLIGSKSEKLSHFHFYFHDIVSGRNPTAVRMAAAPTTNSSTTGFGLVMMADDPLTLGPDMGSRVVGRAQGIYGSADSTQVGLLMALNFVFTEGEFNGSTLSVLGRNAVFAAVREMPVVGGSGIFRFARGYAEARTHEFDLKTGNAVIEYNVYVYHY